MEAECRYCLHLAPHPEPDKYMMDNEGLPLWRCPFGRFDRPTPEGHPIKCWFAWIIIWQAADKVVAKAQANCPRFEFYHQAGKFTETWREMP